MKKFLLSLIILLLCFAQTAFAADDLTGFKYEKEMKRLVDMGVLNGYSDGTYQPHRSVTRAEFAKMVVLAFDLQSPVTSSSVSTSTDIEFIDVTEKHWFAPYVIQAVEAGVITGYPDGTFQPNTLVTREQVATMVSRALQLKGIYTDPSKLDPLQFVDKGSILEVHRLDVQLLSNLGIITGNSDNTFRPKSASTRWMVSLILLRGYDFLFMNPDDSYRVVAIQNGESTNVRQFATFTQAVEYANSSSSADYIEMNSQIVWMKKGLAVTKGYTEVYPTTALTFLNTPDRLKQYRPYLTSNSELQFIEASEKAIQVKLAGKIGYVKAQDVRLIPSELLQGQSYYQRSGNMLRHYLYNHTTNRVTASIEVGPAPDQLVANTKYYSEDGATFYDGNGKFVTESHQYFNKMHLRSKTSYTAEELDRFLADNFPFYNKSAGGVVWKASPLVGTGRFFKEIEAQYDINAMYLLAHAIHESGWGTSKIAQDKRNLFGYGAVDSDPYRDAYTYATYKESIEDAAKRVTATYQSTTAGYYNGSFLGNKALGMNVRYASDPNWGQKIASTMYKIDTFLGAKEFGKQSLGTVQSAPYALNVRADATTSSTILYKLPEDGITVSILGTTNSSGQMWYRLVSEDRVYSVGYAHSSYVKLIPIATNN